MGTVRQQLLILCLATPNPTSAVVGWSLFDGTGGSTTMAGDAEQPPYDSVLAAMQDGWRVLQLPVVQAAAPGREHETGPLPYEFVLEKLVEPAGPRKEKGR